MSVPLNELEEAKVIVSGAINSEANGNMVSFGFNEENIQEWGKESITEFIRGCCSLYKSKKSDSPMWFYSWLDEQAYQIRMSAMSQSHGKLPFGCKFSHAELEVVIDGICAIDSGLYTKGTLDVWHQNI